MQFLASLNFNLERFLWLFVKTKLSNEPCLTASSFDMSFNRLSINFSRSLHLPLPQLTALPHFPILSRSATLYPNHRFSGLSLRRFYEQTALLITKRRKRFCFYCALVSKLEPFGHQFGGNESDRNKDGEKTVDLWPCSSLR
jgi:hypothetical protein